MELLPNFIAHRPVQAAEYDFAGVVALSASSAFPVGTRVFGFIPIAMQTKTSQGALTQYTRVAAKFLARTPDNIASVDAAGTTIVGETAYQCMIVAGGLQPGQSVFINGGSSSVGAYAIMIAKSMGCTVWSSASGPNEGMVKGLGADHVSFAIVDWYSASFSDRHTHSSSITRRPLFTRPSWQPLPPRNFTTFLTLLDFRIHHCT